MNILLINLPREGEVVDSTTPDYLLYDFMHYPPLGLLSIAANVDARHSMKILDTLTNNYSIEDTVKYIVDFKPDLLGISVVTKRLYPMYAISKKIKELLPKTIIIAGGPHINYFPMETMEIGTLDYALPGFGEETFPQFVEIIDKNENIDSFIGSIPGLYYKVNGSIKVNPPDDKPTVLDRFPFPRRELIDLEDYFTAADKVKMTTVYSSRGCPFHCIFCDVQEKKYHYRSAERLVDEFESIAALGIKEIHIFDDTFNFKRQRVIDMCNEIIRRGLKISWSARARVHPIDKEMLELMKAAGCCRLHVGVEALDDNILINIKKQITLEQIYNFFELCNEYKIDTLAYFIIGFPEETEEYRKALFKRISLLKATYVYINILFPTPKSEYYKNLIRDGVYEKDHWAEFVKKPVENFDIPLCRTPELQAELTVLADTIHKKFYLSPRFILNDLKRNTSFKMLWLKAKIAVRLFASTLSIKK